MNKNEKQKIKKMKQMKNGKKRKINNGKNGKMQKWRNGKHVKKCTARDDTSSSSSAALRDGRTPSLQPAIVGGYGHLVLNV